MRSTPAFGRAASLVAVCVMLGAGCAQPSQGPRSGADAASLAGSQPSNGCPAPSIPPGTYEERTALKDGVVPFAVGHWIMIATDVADPNCYYPLAFIEHQHGDIVFTDSHPYTVEGNRIVLHANDEPNAHYRAHVHGGSIWFSGGLDDGGARRSILVAHQWTEVE